MDTPTSPFEPIYNVTDIVPSAVVSISMMNRIDRASIWLRGGRLSEDAARQVLNFIISQTNWLPEVLRWSWRDRVAVAHIDCVRTHTGAPVPEPF